MTRRALVVVAALLAVAAACITVAVLHLHGTPPLWKLALLVVLLGLSECNFVRLRFGAEHYGLSWGEAVLLLELTLVPAAWIVVLALPVVAVSQLLLRRPLVKSLFNGASYTVAASVAVLLATSLTSAPYVFTDLRHASALVLAVAAFSLATALSTSTVVAAAQGSRVAPVLLSNARLASYVLVGNVVVAGGLLALAQRAPETLWGLPPALLGVGMLYRAYVSATQEREAWQQLEAATRDLNRLEERDIAAAALGHASTLFRTDEVALVIDALGGRGRRTWVLGEDGEARQREPFEDLPQSTTDIAELSGSTLDLPVSTCVVSPLQGPTGRMGSLRLSFNGPVRLARRERQVLATYSHAVSTTLLNAALYASAVEEAARQAHQASHDPLTGLANRSLLQQRTVQALAEADRTTAMLLLDLDHFKEINDTLGHAAGDELLVHVAQRLRAAVRAEDLVARLGGDEFAVLLTGLSSPEAVEPVAEKVLALLAQPVAFEGLQLSIEGSMGVACHPDDVETAEELFRRCDVAMYQAKATRGSWLRYDALRDDSSVQRLALVSELREALADQLVVHFQPQVEMSNGRVTGAEALVRWQHPVRGLLQPVEFVGVAEQSGLVRPFTLRVLDLAVEECVRWQTPEQPVTVAVNLGARSLLDRGLADDVAEVLAKHGLPPHLLVLEITETTAASSLEVVEEVLGRLRRLGVQLSVDDFGTGYSSLAFLQRTAVHELKVDRSFVQGMLVNDNDKALVRATVQLAHSLGARAVAEGVETQALVVALAALGCDVLQGYHLSRPVPAEVVRDLVGRQVVAMLPSPRAEAEPRRLSVVRRADAG